MLHLKHFIVAKNPFVDSFADSDFLGKSIYLTLAILSVASWTLLIYKTYVAHGARISSLRFMKQEAAAKRHPLTWDAPLSKRSYPNSFGELYTAIKEKTVEVLDRNRAAAKNDDLEKQTIHLSRCDLELIETNAQAQIASQAKHLDKNLFILSLVTTLAPFLGLLGTVWGILLSFSEMQTASSGGNQLMMAGLSMALATTVLGLLVAIPALIAHSYLKNFIRDFTIEMEQFVTELLSAIEIQYRRVDS